MTQGRVMRCRRQWLAVWLLCVAATLPAGAREIAPPLPAVGTVEVLFPPWDDAEAALIIAVDAARQQVLVQAFLLTSRKIAASLVAAHRRGVDVRVLADARQHAEHAGSLLVSLSESGIPVALETRYRHAHNKLMVIDAAGGLPVVITGSFNYTWSAQHKNAENLLILRGHAALADRYARNWWRHRVQATSLEAERK
jgi:phosphatidylserine/phosphatidylglycerophosphate/cardiolipin synthase-like enzyme